MKKKKDVSTLAEWGVIRRLKKEGWYFVSEHREKMFIEFITKEIRLAERRGYKKGRRDGIQYLYSVFSQPIQNNSQEDFTEYLNKRLSALKERI